MTRGTTTKHGECFSNVNATVPRFAPPRRKSTITLIAIIISIATVYQKYQLTFTFQSERQFLYTNKTAIISNSSFTTEATVYDKVIIKPFKLHENITTERNANQSNSNENNINKTATVVNDVLIGQQHIVKEEEIMINKQSNNYRSEKNVTLFDKNSKYQNCWLSSDINLLGCGMDGHAFRATMNCPNINRNDVVLKIPIAFNDTEEGKHLIYISETDSSLKSLVELHHLVMDNTTTKIRQYFALPLGTATFQTELLLKEVYTNKKSTKRCMEIIPNSSSTTASTNTTSNTTVTFTTNDETVLGTIMEYGGSNKLSPDKLTDPDDRRRVVKDLVCMYQHMYNRKFLHQDLSFFHLHDDGMHTSMIDFGRVDILRGWNKTDENILQKVQFFQLMTFISNVCSQNYDKYKVINRIKVSLFDEYKQLNSNMTSELKKCEFNAIKSSSILFGDNITTSETYQTLLDILDEKCQ